MHAGTTRWSALDEGARAASLDEARRRLRAGGLVIAPTETVYGLLASAADSSAVGLLRDATASDQPQSSNPPPAADGPRFTWHAPTTDAVRERLALPTPVHRRLIEKLLPGPVRFVLEQHDADRAAALEALGVPAGVIDHGGWLAVRVSAHPVFHEIVAGAGVPVVADRLGRTPWGDPGPRADAVGDTTGFPGVVIDDGPLHRATPSTTVRLGLNGSIAVAPAGPGGVQEADVLAALRRRIVFVCTGNTCRSPMAAAIARQILADRGRAEDGVEVVIESAGVATGDGLPPSPEAVEAIAEMGGDLRAHRSRHLTREILERADLVLTMTGDHLARARSLDPAHADKMERLDPSGDVPDPIGGPQEVYRATAARLREVIGARFEELGV